MEEKIINILYLKNTINYLPNENLAYIVTEELDGTYKIKNIPTYFINHLTDLYSNLAYNYDSLSQINKINYEDCYKKMKMNINETFSEDVKIYKKKNI